nr:P3 protein [Narcissus yellow stripe virus]
GDPLAEETTEQILSDPNWNLQLLIQGIYKPRVMQENLIWNRYLPLYAMLSPGILLAFYNSGSLETMTKYFLQKDNDLVVLLVILESLATKVSKSRSVLAQLHILEKGASDVIEAVQNIKQRHTIPYTTVMKMLMVLATRAKANLELNIAGYNQIRLASIEVMEKNYLQVLEEQWRGLSWSAEFCVILRSSRFTLRTRKSLHPTDTTDLGGRYSESIASYFGQLTQAAKCGKDKILNKGKHYVSTARMYSTRKACSLINYMVPDIVKFINVLFVVSLLLSIARECQHLLNIYSESKERMSQTVAERDMAQIELMYKMYVMENKEKPTRDEFIEYLEKVDPQLATYLKSEEEVTHQ